AGLVGPLGVLVYLVMGLLTAFTALNYSELGSAIPLAGGGYSFTSRTLPKPLAFFTGWFFWIGNTTACAMYVVIFALTIKEYFWHGANVALIGLVTTLVFAAINLRGMSEAIKIIAVMNLVELAILLGVASLGLMHVESANLSPIAPLGVGGLLPGMALIYISYVGFDLITVASEEIIDPGRTIPRAILITLAVGTGIYVFVVWVMMGVVPHTELAESEIPFIFVADRLFGGWGRHAAILATVMASLSAFSVTLGASARVLYALGRDGHFPSFFARLHPTYRTPHVALAVCAAFVIAFAASGAVRFVASMADFGFLMGLGVVNYSVISLRARMPNLRRPFSAGWYPWVPILGMVTCWGLVPALELRSLALGTALTLVGALAYLYREENRRELQRLPGVFRYWLLLLRVFRRPKLRVLIICGGQQGRNIAERLLAMDEHRLLFRTAQHQITFVEEDEDCCAQLEKRYNVPVYQGDGTKRAVLEQVGKDYVDVAIAAFDDDGRNLIAALQAKQLGMPRVMAIVQDPDYLPLLEAEGVVAVSAPWATASMVENYLERPGVAELFDIGRGVANLIDLIVPEGAQVAGQVIQQIDLPKECVVAAVIRGDAYVVPRGDTEIAIGDHVIIVGPPRATKSARDAFVKTK
ncbi:MAG: amino acid permease, partial [Deltaproteobacteria bacterium]|nr:amino acid permease [Deltaproteobacteria bacterium]